MDDQTPPNEQVVTMTIPVDETPQQNTEAQVSESAVTEESSEIPPVIPETSPVDSKEIEQAVKQPSEKPKEPEHNVTRPCLYCSNKENIQKMTDEYYESCKKGNKPAYVQELAVILDVDRDTIHNWIKDEDLHPQLFGTIKKIRTIQELWLLKRTIGRYNPTGAIFQLKTNHKYIESEKQILAGDKMEPIQIEIIEEANKFSNEE